MALMAADPSSGPVADLAGMLAGMTPVMDPERYVFVTFPPEDLSAPLLHAALGMFREAEGISLILPQAYAQAQGLPVTGPAMARITLMVYSALDGVGLSAAVAGALAAQGIACNMVAATHHDHVFVPQDQARHALTILLDVQSRSQT